MRVLLGIVAFSMMAPACRADVLYVSSDLSHEILRFDADSGAFTDVFITAVLGGLNQPHGILERESDVLVCSFGTDQVLRYDKDTGAFLGEFIGPASGLDDPVYMIQLENGDLLISSQASDEILRYASDATPLGALVGSGSGGLDGPSGFAFGPDTRLYVAGRYSANVLVYNASTGAFEEELLNSADGLGVGNTFGLQFSGDGAMYVASNANVHRVDVSTATILNSTPFSFPIGLEVDPDGDILVASDNNLRRLDTSAGDSVSTPLLTGGIINLLNFFHRAAPACAADLNDDATIDGADLGLLLAQWGGTGDADLNDDGTTDGADLGLLLAAWGAC